MIMDINQPFVTQEQKFKYWEESKAEIQALRAKVASSVSGEEVAYTDGKEDFMSVATYEEYKKLGFFTKCKTPLYTTPQQPQEQGELVRKAVADALEEAVNICDRYLDDLYSFQIDSVKDEILSLIKRNAEGE